MTDIKRKIRQISEQAIVFIIQSKNISLDNRHYPCIMSIDCCQFYAILVLWFALWLKIITDANSAIRQFRSTIRQNTIASFHQYPTLCSDIALGNHTTELFLYVRDECLIV